MRFPYAVIAFLSIYVLVIAQPVQAQMGAPVRSDLQIIAGKLNVSDGFADRSFFTTWGNTYFANGFGLHSELHGIDREEAASFFTGGISYNSQPFSIQAVGGGSSENEFILPDSFGRITATLRSPAAQGLVLVPAFTFRNFRAGISEVAAEVQLLKYIPVAPSASIILEVMGRATQIGVDGAAKDRFAPAFSTGVTYADYKKFAVGVNLEAGGATYDGLRGIGLIDEDYWSVRPNASVFVTKNTELIASGEYTDRESFQVIGGFAGVKFHFD